MAKIITELDIETHFSNPKLNGEKLVYKACEDKLGNDWFVFYSVNWFGTSNSFNEKRDGEIDFLFVHPEYGTFVCEVKGGVEIFLKDNQWFSKSKNGNINEIKNPFEQAKSNKYSLLNRYKSEKEIERTNIRIFHLVIFPEVSTITGSFPLYIDESIMITSLDLSNIERKLINIFQQSNKNALNELSLKVDSSNFSSWLRTKLNPTFSAERSVKDWLHETENRIVELSEQQYRIYQGLWSNRTLNISGCAGSGKTILATTRAIELAKSGIRTLLVCYNSLLGKEFERIMHKTDNLTSSSFHSLVLQIIKENNQQCLDFDEAVNLLEVKLLTDQIDRFEAVIIDEAQDFTERELEIIQLMTLPDSIYISFSDDNQKIIKRSGRTDVSFQFHLFENFRNSKQIFNVLLKHYSENDPMYHKGPDGKEIKVLRKYPFNDKNALFGLLNNEIKLLINSKIKKSDIVVLTFKSKEKSFLNFYENKEVNLNKFSDDMFEDAIRIDTVRRFKGLDAPVVILTELDDESLSDVKSWNKMCYVAYSRARSLLVIIPPSNIEHQDI